MIKMLSEKWDILRALGLPVVGPSVIQSISMHFSWGIFACVFQLCMIYKQYIYIYIYIYIFIAKRLKLHHLLFPVLAFLIDVINIISWTCSGIFLKYAVNNELFMRQIYTFKKTMIIKWYSFDFIRYFTGKSVRHLKWVQSIPYYQSRDELPNAHFRWLVDDLH
jgi:hypothetical protein